MNDKAKGCVLHVQRVVADMEKPWQWRCTTHGRGEQDIATEQEAWTRATGRCGGLFSDVWAERRRQDNLYGPVRSLDLCEWMCVLMEEVGEAAQAVHEIAQDRRRATRDDLREELIQVAAVAVNICEHMDRGDV